MSVFFMNFDMAPSVIWARDLYDQMQIRSDFRKWFPRMCQYGFVEGRDYEVVPRVRPQDEGGRTVQRYVKDYRITLEMAKQLYKLHHFHKNDCFRSCEGQHCMGTDTGCRQSLNCCISTSAKATRRRSVLRITAAGFAGDNDTDRKRIRLRRKGVQSAAPSARYPVPGQ